MDKLTNTYKKNPGKFCCGLAGLVLGLAAFILYLTTGVIRGFTNEYSTPMIIVMVIGIVANIIFLFIRKDTVEVIPFMAYVIAVFFFLQVNASYIVAVVRAIDITRVSNSFIGTIVCLLAGAVVYIVGFCFPEK